jgi:protein-S-isoprenylcysteine O-methyltransferase
VAWTAIRLWVAFLVVDTVLSGRYAGGDGRHDRDTSRMLVISLASNMAFALFSGWSGFGGLSAAWLHLAPVGLAITVVGIVVRYGAIGLLGERFTWRVTILEGHRLYDQGLYRLIRHPSYTGGLLAFYGAALTFGSWLAMVLFTVSHVPIVLYRIRVEEALLETHFGPVYHAYQARTHRLVPFLY